jgi:FixJ family two-component response regulator
MRSTSTNSSGFPGPSVVYVVDDDEEMRLALGGLLRSVGHQVELCDSPVEFVNCVREDVARCLILDVRLRGENGLAFQRSIAKIAPHLPILFMSAYADVEMSVKAMKAGAADFFTKPIREQDMLDAVAQALMRDAERLSADVALSELRHRFETLTPKEHEVLEFVITGLLNKQIADEMHVSEITVKLHRGQVMRKMGAHSVVDLVRLAQMLSVVPRTPTRRRA